MRESVFHVDVIVSIPVMVRVNEEDEMVQVCAVLTSVENTERNFTITLATKDATGEEIHCSEYLSI